VTVRERFLTTGWYDKEIVPMALRFYNTLTQQVEEFHPLHDNVVRMYTCGPTVYNFVHIGNLRTFTFQDILRRWLRARGYTLDHVMNITDVEDKIIRNAAAQNKSLAEYTAVYTQAFLDDAATIRLERPERLVKATEHIADMVATIEQLGERGFTYVSEGSVYYRIANFPSYGGPARVWMSMNMTRPMLGISFCGRRRKMVNPAGRGTASEQGVPAGTSNAP
jgi:cysteinyl-tRNA synthetase